MILFQLNRFHNIFILYRIYPSCQSIILKPMLVYIMKWIHYKRYNKKYLLYNKSKASFANSNKFDKSEVESHGMVDTI